LLTDPEDERDAVIEGVVEGLVLARIVKVKGFSLNAYFPEFGTSF
jgi:hypothetical protein